MLTYDDLVEWAGEENVTRADAACVAGWQVPEDQTALLVSIGIPITDNLIEAAAFQTETAPRLLTRDGKRLYQLTENRHGDLVPDLLWTFGVEPVTGTVYYVLPDGEAWFANSSIALWLQCLHHYGRHVSQSEILNDPDEDEDGALAELSQLAAELKQIDPPAFDGYNGFIWAEFLDRWLW
ncbi:SUKH-4 family immunity protein [Streptomyces sp. NPDC059443]|uniref:SUKH-4 family immunity protein n=1 Tax=unclassified Streptomyces TaxID=2593676 RepID=UPI0036B1723B